MSKNVSYLYYILVRCAFVAVWLTKAVVLQGPGQRAAFGVRGAGDSPVAAVVAAAAIAGSEMIEMIVVNSGMVANISSGPALASEG